MVGRDNHYFGISGAAPFGNFTDATIISPGFLMGGILSRRGMVLEKGNVKVAQVRDGLSNTMLIGEICGYVRSSDGVFHDNRPGQGQPWFAGSWPNTGAIFGSRWDIGPHISTTTVRYTPNKGVTLTGGVADLQGVGFDNPPFSNYWSHQNTQLSSLHSGGVNVLLGDGSVRFVSNSIDLGTLT